MSPFWKVLMSLTRMAEKSIERVVKFVVFYFSNTILSGPRSQWKFLKMKFAVTFLLFV